MSTGMLPRECTISTENATEDAQTVLRSGSENTTAGAENAPETAENTVRMKERSNDVFFKTYKERARRHSQTAF